MLLLKLIYFIHWLFMKMVSKVMNVFYLVEKKLGYNFNETIQLNIEKNSGSNYKRLSLYFSIIFNSHY